MQENVQLFKNRFHTSSLKEQIISLRVTALPLPSVYTAMHHFSYLFRPP